MRRSASLLALALLAACGGEEDAAPPAALPALAGPSSLLRLPRTGGPVTAYLPADLRAAGWTSSGRLGPLQTPLGVNLDERLAFAVDRGDNLVAVDLETRGVRGSILGGVTAATMAGDGSIYIVEQNGRVTHLLRRMPTRYRARLPARPASLFGALNDRLVVITEGEEPAVLVLARDSEAEPHPVPAGQAAATLWGDLVAIAADTAVVLYDAQRRRPLPGFRVGGGARAVAFSPSGHRIYVGTSRPEVQVFNRFTLDRIATIPVTAPVTAIRPDASGRWILLGAAGTDSVDVADATVNRLVARLPGAWDSDLPLVAGAATLIVRHGEDVEAWDIGQLPPVRTGSVTGGAADFWTMATWVPPTRLAERDEENAPPEVVQDSAIAFGVIPPVQPPQQASRVFLQVSSSQNAAWARELARQLAGAGYPSLVRDPQGPDDGYRVLVGPYPSREAAEEAGRRLGRPFFVLTEGSLSGTR
jgi:hypothetical protein